MPNIEIDSKLIDDILTAQTYWVTIPSNLRRLWSAHYPNNAQKRFIGSVIAIKQATGCWPVVNSFSPEMRQKIMEDRSISITFND